MKKTILALLIALMVFLVSGCSLVEQTTSISQTNTTIGTISTSTTKNDVITTLKDNAKYLGIELAPEYKAISEEGYTSLYFDSENGNDNNDGRSESTAKKSVSAINAAIKSTRSSTPTKILLKGTFEGTINVTGYTSSESKPLIISSYGNKKAVIDGSGNDDAILLNGGDVRIFDLEVTNVSGKRGIYVYTNGIRKNVVIENCYIHNVNWNWTYSESEEDMASHLDDLGLSGVKSVDPTYVYETGGIIFNTGIDQVSYLENVWVKDNVIEKVSRSGVFMTSQWVKRLGVAWGYNPYCDDEHGYYPSKNVNYVGNYINISGGDGLVMIGVRNGYFESNISYNANYLGRSGTANVGMWPISSENITIQFNEGAYCKLCNGGNDGEGFDIDIGCKNTIFQYNYSHDNDGPGLLICNTGSVVALCDEDGNIRKENGKVVQLDARADWEHCIIRNNVFVNNGAKNRPTLMHVAGSCWNVTFENNTVIYTGISTQPLVSISMWDEKYDKANDFTFKNNIFYSPVENTSVFSMECFGEDYLFVGNLYYNISEDQIEAVNDSKVYRFDPGFESVVGIKGYENVEVFTPTNNKCFINGLKLPEKNLYDILMNETRNTQYLGAIAKQ